MAMWLCGYVAKWSPCPSAFRLPPLHPTTFLGDSGTSVEWPWVRGGHFTVHFKLWTAQKLLRRIILLHFGLVTFRFHFGKTRQVFILGILWLLDVTMTPKNQLFLTLDTPICIKYAKTIPNNFWNMFLEPIGFGKYFLECFGKDRDRTSWRSI